jgi:hypothetical protein
VLASRAIVGSNISLANLTALTPASTDHVLLSVTLPIAADDQFQGLSSTLSFSFAGA